jgi:hypothetical protein
MMLKEGFIQNVGFVGTFYATNMSFTLLNDTKNCSQPKVVGGIMKRSRKRYNNTSSKLVLAIERDST